MGLGAMGRGIARCALQKHDLEIVAAIDLDPHRVGRKLSDVVDAPTPEVVIGSDAGAEMRKAQGGILLHATGSRLDRIEGELAQALTAGLCVVSTCAELSYPWLRHPEIAERLDRLAQQRKLAPRGAGVHPRLRVDPLPGARPPVCRRGGRRPRTHHRARSSTAARRDRAGRRPGHPRADPGRYAGRQGHGLDRRARGAARAGLRAGVDQRSGLARWQIGEDDVVDRNAAGREAKPAVNEVEKGAIRRFAEAIGETNPIYFEEAAARAAGYRSVVAPPTFPTTLRAASDLREGLMLAPGKHLLQAEQSFEYARPIVAGDKLTVRSKVAGIESRPTPSGPTDVVIIEDEGRDDAGELVYRSRQLWVVRMAPKHAPGEFHE